MATSHETRTIIIAMDGSEFSENAFDWYWSNVRRESDKVVLLHVPEFNSIVQSPMEISDFTCFTSLYAEEQQMTNAFIEQLTEKLKNKNAGGKVRRVNGIPGEIIVRVSQEEDADLVITGSRGMGTIRRTIMGSVSDYVLHHATVPVLVYRQ